MLKSLHIQHYKSLADVYLEFSPITLLVGPNGMGKSNIVDALRFLKDAITHGLDYAIHERGGIDVLRQYAPRRPYTTSLRIDFDYHLGDEEYQTFYSLKIAGKKGDYQIVEEEAFWIDQIHVLGENGQKLDTEVQQVNLHRDKQGNVRINDEKQKQIVPFDQLVISNLPFLNMSPTLAWILRKLCFSSIYPNTLREPSRPDSDRQLKGDGSNWASILKAMRQRKEEQVLKKIEALMRRVIPGFESVRVKGVGGYLVPQFLVQDKPGARSHYLDPVQLSDGTLRIFGLLLSLYQQPPPYFLGLEEPEQTIHPGLLGLLADAFREVSETTQLLMTTHSPYLLDYFKPEEIRVVTLEEGETQVAPMRKSQTEAVKQKLMSMSEIMALDGLRPELES